MDDKELQDLRDWAAGKMGWVWSNEHQMWDGITQSKICYKVILAVATAQCSSTVRLSIVVMLIMITLALPFCLRQGLRKKSK